MSASRAYARSIQKRTSDCELGGKEMKKRIAFVLCLVLTIAALAGCAQTKTADNAAAGESAATSEAASSTKTESTAPTAESSAADSSQASKDAESKADSKAESAAADAAKAEESKAESAASEAEAAEKDAENAEKDAEAAGNAAAEGEASADSAGANASANQLGGWQKPESPVIPDSVRASLDKALESKLGAEYTPVAYIGCQVVNGTNHAILCRTKAVAPDAKETYTVVYLYEDLQGNAEIKDIVDSSIPSDMLPGLVGGWQAAEDPTITNELRDKLGYVFGKRLGSDFTPIALLGTQVVAGTNYCVLGEAMPVVPNAESHYVIAYIYEDLQGNLKITEIKDFS